MSNLTEIRQAHERLTALLEQEILGRRGQAAELRRFQKWLDTAFYLLGWANFEYLTRKEVDDRILDGMRSKGRERYAWAFLQEGIKGFSVRRRLELIFHGQAEVVRSLKKSYDVRNESAHDYKKLPPEVNDLSGVLQEWEDLVDKF